MHSSLRVAIAILAMSLGVACAARTPPLDPSALARAGERVRQGCYDCLLEARADYERVAATGRAALVARPLFEVNLLIALREKELALEPSDALTRARALAAQMPPEVLAAQYLELVAAVPPDQAGTPKTVLGEHQTVLLKFRRQAAAWVEQGAIDPVVREYIALTLECSRAAISGAAPRVPRPLGAPLLAFRRAICASTPDAEALDGVRSDVPRFVDTALFLARATLVARQGAAAGSVTSKSMAAARALLNEALDRFPRSSAITYELGVVAQIEGDLRRAAGHYTATLDLQPRHEDARLARAMSYTYLNDPANAMSDAATLIEAGAYNRGEAFYWRAFNRHRAKELERARADIEQAKVLASSSRVLTLAGMIEHDQQELDAATADLVEAARLEPGNCVARWYLGIVKHSGEQWLDSGVAFADAARCYDGSAARAERARDEMAARTDLDSEFRARQLAGFDSAIKDDRTQESASALNAAIGYARGGDTHTAERYIDQAAKDPARRTTAEDLRQVMRGPH